MKRFIVFAYGITAYLLFLAVFSYLAGFLLNLLVPKAINTADGAQTSLGASVTINLLLIATFGFFHSLLARDHVKAVLLKVLPAAAERSTYVVQSSLCLALAMWQWQALPGTIWHIDGFAAVMAYVGFAIGASLVLWSTFLIDHFELFGLRQIWTHMRNAPMPQPEFRTPALYKIVRHPMQLGVIVLLFATPHMTWGHLLFAGAMTAYIFVGLYFEERALLRTFGDRYATYQRNVPMLFPMLKPRGQQITARN
ncbi:NnrU family protein [Cognatiyoonia sp. IB215446]|uniref:methyltransferase family protein n=1 Tax=Cognatiyoonia sp. IB215446 TaxID=3097355 RepID=UPI002A14B12F|nr:NnrU family protein [Cognatiyoonia sp. IB215446]MDX8346953.1 NnrU family protein [Cognatiyoonia sp. IB215446]